MSVSLQRRQRGLHGTDRSVGWKYSSILALITILFYWKIVFTNQFTLLTGYEAVNQAYSWFTFWVHSIRNSSWPLWDPYTFSGHVFSGEMQTGSFYPLYLPMVMLPLTRAGLLAPMTYHIMFVLSHFLAAWFTFRLARELGTSNFAALIAGICFSFGGFLARLPGWPHLLNSGIWLPLILLYVVRATKEATAGRAALEGSFAGLFLGLSILAGGLHVAIMQAIVGVTATTFYFWRAGSSAGGISAWRRAVLIICVMGGVAAAAGAVQLFPSVQYSHRALRYLGSTALPASQKIPYFYLKDNFYANSIFNFLVSFAYAGQVGSGETMNPYFGVFPFFLACIGIWKQWEDRWVPYLTWLAVAAFAYSLGAASLLHGILYALTPYLWLAREASRFIYLADFALAVLAAFGAESVFAGLTHSGYWRPVSRLTQWLIGLVVLALAIPALYGQPALNLWSSLSLLLIGTSSLLLRYVCSHRAAAFTRFLAVALILFDLSAFDWSISNRLEEAAKGTDEMTRLLSCDGFVRFLKSQHGMFRVQMETRSAPDIGDAFEVQTTAGNGVTLLTEYAEFMGHSDLLNVKYIVRPATAADPGPVYQDSSWKVYENSRAYPRAWLVHDVDIEPTPTEIYKRIDNPAVDLHRTALIARELDTPLGPATDVGSESVSFQRYSASRIDLTVHSSGTAMLVLSEIYYPGWRSTVNARPARIWKVDGPLRGIVVPAGDSRVSLYYEPTPIHVGAILSVASFGALLPSLILLQFFRLRSPPKQG